MSSPLTGEDLQQWLAGLPDGQAPPAAQGGEDAAGAAAPRVPFALAVRRGGAGLPESRRYSELERRFLQDAGLVDGSR